MSGGFGFQESSGEESSSGKGTAGFNVGLRDEAGKTGLNLIKNILLPQFQSLTAPQKDSQGQVVPLLNSQGLFQQQAAAVPSLLDGIFAKESGNAASRGRLRPGDFAGIAGSSLNQALVQLLPQIGQNVQFANTLPIQQAQVGRDLAGILAAFGQGSEREQESSGSRSSFGIDVSGGVTGGGGGTVTG